MPELSEKYKVLIQALLSRGPLSKKEVLSILDGRNHGSRDQLLNEYLSRIDQELSFFRCEMRGCRNQYHGQIFYDFVYNVSDEQSQLGTKYSVPQIAFYKDVKDKTLEDLTRDRWLCSTSDGKIGLGVRSFLDLRSWFSNSEISSSELCDDATIKAELCPNEICSARLHKYCLKKRSLQRRIEKVFRRGKHRSCTNGHAAAYHPSSSRSQDPQPRGTMRSSARLRK